MYNVSITTIGGIDLYTVESEDIDVIVASLDQAVLDLNIERDVSIKNAFDDLFENYLIQKSFMENAKLAGVFMTGGVTLDGRYLEMTFKIKE